MFATWVPDISETIGFLKIVPLPTLFCTTNENNFFFYVKLEVSHTNREMIGEDLNPTK